MATTPLRDQLIDIVRQARQVERDMTTSLSEAVRNTQGTIDRWSVKNVITHSASAKNGLAHDLAVAREGSDVTPFNAEYQSFNDRTFRQYEHAAWDEVTAYADGAVDTLVAEIEQYDDEQLRQPKLQAWLPEGVSVSEMVLGLGILHPYHHVGWLYVENGNPSATDTLFETIIPLHYALHTSPQALGSAHYDLACSYARLGRDNLAISHLQNAFAKCPDLMEWAKTDPDLDSLRAESGFQSLVDA